MENPTQIEIGYEYVRSDGVVIIPTTSSQMVSVTFFRWPNGTVSGFGTWDDLQKDIEANLIVEVRKKLESNKQSPSKGKLRLVK